MTKNVLAIIGGSGIYNLPELNIEKEHTIETPFGLPSSSIIEGTLGKTKLLFIARHGIGHKFLPGEVNYQANIFALKKLGATHLVSICAVGSLKEEIEPGHLVIVDQFIDRTKGRKSTMFGNGIVGHVMFADPVCNTLSTILADCSKELGYKVHEKGCLCVMEGPAFSTRAESNLHRNMGADLIGMTTMPEAKLAREAELCYGTLALATDYDCWHSGHDDVTVGQVIETMNSNIGKARKVITLLADKITTHNRSCGCKSTLDGAIMTNLEIIPKKTKDELKPILRRIL